MTETVLVTRDADVAIVTLNRPHALNALDNSMLDGFIDAMNGLNADASVAAVVLTVALVAAVYIARRNASDFAAEFIAPEEEA